MEIGKEKKVEKKNGIFLSISVSGLITKVFFFFRIPFFVIFFYIDGKKSVSLPVTRSHSSIKVYVEGHQRERNLIQPK